MGMPKSMDVMILSQKPTPGYLLGIEQLDWKKLYEEERDRNEILLKQIKDMQNSSNRVAEESYWKRLYEEERKRNENLLIQLNDAQKSTPKDLGNVPQLQIISTNFTTKQKFERCLKKLLASTPIHSLDSFLEVIITAHNDTQSQYTRDRRSIFVGEANTKYYTTRDYHYMGKYGNYWFVIVDD